MPSFVFEVTRKRVWGAVKHGVKKAWHFGPVSLWWVDGRVSDKLAQMSEALAENRRALTYAELILTKARSVIHSEPTD